MSLKNSMFCSPELAKAIKAEPWLEHIVKITDLPLSLYDECKEDDGTVWRYVLKNAFGIWGYDDINEVLEEAQDMAERLKPFIRAGKTPKPNKNKHYIMVYFRQ